MPSGVKFDERVPLNRDIARSIVEMTRLHLEFKTVTRDLYEQCMGSIVPWMKAEVVLENRHTIVSLCNCYLENLIDEGTFVEMYRDLVVRGRWLTHYRRYPTFDVMARGHGINRKSVEILGLALRQFGEDIIDEARFNTVVGKRFPWIDVKAVVNNLLTTVTICNVYLAGLSSEEQFYECLNAMFTDFHVLGTRAFYRVGMGVGVRVRPRHRSGPGPVPPTPTITTPPQSVGYRRLR